MVPCFFNRDLALIFLADNHTAIGADSAAERSLVVGDNQRSKIAAEIE